MKKEQLEEIRKRCEAATPGPWTSSRKDIDSYTSNPDEPEYGTQHVVYVYLQDDEPRFPLFGNNARNNAEFIAHARQDIPALLDALNEAEGRITGARLYRAMAEDYEADRDRYKAKAEALERAILSGKGFACSVCKHESKKICLVKTSGGTCKNYSNWTFDEQRFSE